MRVDVPSDAGKAELEFLQSIVREDTEALRSRLGGSTPEILAFLRFARRHKLAAFAYSTLHELGLGPALAPAVRTAFRIGAMHERALSERLRGHLHLLGDVLERGRTPVLFMKGPLFAQRFYGSVEARGVSDLDLLIQSPREIDGIEPLLVEAGFAPSSRLRVGHRLAAGFTHHYEYRRDHLPLDVHWALQTHVSFAIDYSRVWSTASTVELAGRTYRATSDEYELVLQILGVITDLQVGKLRLRSVVDIYRLLRTVSGVLDWDAFFAWRSRERLLRPSAYVLALVLDVLDGADEFAPLAARLEPLRTGLPATTLAQRALLKSHPLDPRQKLLALRLYEAPLVVSLSWWILSLPFRLAVYGVSQQLLRQDG